MVITQHDLFENECFHKYAHNSGPRGSPDIIMTAFDVKFDEETDEVPPEAWNPQTKIKKHNKWKNAT